MLCAKLFKRPKPEDQLQLSCFVAIFMTWASFELPFVFCSNVQNNKTYKLELCCFVAIFMSLVI